MVQQESTTFLGSLTSPVAGMSMSHWLGEARRAEQHLVSLLQRDDLSGLQQAKARDLLAKVQSCLAQQLERVNTLTAACAARTVTRLR
jgi:hypothetical protein